MILSDIRRYLEQRGQASIGDIALHFSADTDAVRGMLDVWIKKGRVEKRSSTISCGSTCQQCDPASTEIYIWKNKTIELEIPLPSHCDHG